MKLKRLFGGYLLYKAVTGGRTKEPPKGPPREEPAAGPSPFGAGTVTVCIVLGILLAIFLIVKFG